MFAKAAFPSTQTLTQTNAFCSKGREESLKSSPTPQQPGMGRHTGRGWGALTPASGAPPRAGGAEGTLAWKPRLSERRDRLVMSSWDSAVPGRGGSPSVHVPLGPRNTGLLGKRVFVDATGLASLRGDSPELPGGACTHQPASPWETEGAAAGPRAPGPQRLGEAGRTHPRSFRRPPASILTSCLEAERAQFWWFTLLWPPHGPQTEPTAS